MSGPAGPVLDLRATLSWRLPSGPLAAVTDVTGVRVGHAERVDPAAGWCTGVTVLDVEHDLLEQPLPAAVHVINGYGKSTGLMQVAELGELESPVALTGVFGVASVLGALVERHLERHPAVGGEATGRSVNAVVLECNDSYLHDPRAGSPGAVELQRAFATATSGAVPEGTVGAGVGTGTFGFAGGVGTASRAVAWGHGVRHVGVLVLTNVGRREDLVVAGRQVGRAWVAADGVDAEEADGSVVVVLATDLPLDALQLGRACRRVQNGLARTGCTTAGGSGEVVLGFSTAPLLGGAALVGRAVLDEVFVAVAEAVEESVLRALLAASPATGRAQRRREALDAAQLAALLDG